MDNDALNNVEIDNRRILFTKIHEEQLKESNNLPDRYSGDKCMIMIEEFPVKEANNNSSGAMFCIGCIIKYLWRLEKKGDPLEQLEKVQWYLDRLRSYYKKDN